MNVLIACEESQAVCKAFRERGHRAFSADIQPCSGGHPEWHILGDCLPLINGNCTFQTMDTHTHTHDGPWDLLIAHPPCTFLSAAGAVRLFDKNHEIKDHARFVDGLKAAVFFLRFLAADCPRIAVENPTQLSVFNLPRPTQAIQPYEHGDPWLKRTCLWLRGLPPLVQTHLVEPQGYWTKCFRDPKTRSKTFPGIAAAMAEQWGGLEEK